MFIQIIWRKTKLTSWGWFPLHPLRSLLVWDVGRLNFELQLDPPLSRIWTRQK